MPYDDVRPMWRAAPVFLPVCVTLLVLLLLCPAARASQPASGAAVARQAPPEETAGVPGSSGGASFTVKTEASPARGGNSGRRLVAGVFASPPFVMTKDGTTFYGLLPDLWKTVEDRLSLATEYVLYHNLEALLSAAEKGEVDMVFTNLAVTFDRAAVLDFSYPWFDSGLRIMVSAEGRGGSVLAELRNSGQIRAYIWMLVVLFLTALGVTLLRRRYEPGFTGAWHDGVITSLHDLVFAAKSGQLPVSHFGWVGKLASCVWMLFGVAFIAYITSTVTSAMTTVSLTHDINNVFDLHGKNVGVLSGSQAERYLVNLGLRVIPYDEPEQAFKAFGDKDLRAVVMDYPMLEYYAHMHPRANAKVVGKVFNPDKYAFGFTRNHDPIVTEISREIIRMQQDGELEQLKRTYFGVHH